MEKLGTEGEKTFECENCEITFSEKESLQKHQDEVCQKYKCDKCETDFPSRLSSFPLLELLEKHAIIHGNDEYQKAIQILCEYSAGYKCIKCGKGFKQAVFVSNHYQKKHGN